MRRMMNWMVPVVMLGMASAFVSTAKAADFSEQGHFSISTEWGTLKRGWNTATMTVLDHAGQPAEHLTINLDYDMTAMPMNPPNAEITEIGGGQYTFKFFLGMRGAYRFNFQFVHGEITDTWVTEAGAK